MSFDQFYIEQYQDRWASLREALLRSERQIARVNQFQNSMFISQEHYDCPAYSGTAFFDVPAGAPTRDELSGLLQYYVMDPASLEVACALSVESHHDVLDMCAAPGGKTLILAEALKGGTGHLIANEVSEARRDRLMKVIQQYVDRETRDRIRVSGKDGGIFAKSHPEAFDRILIDAPCSGERHLLQSPKDLKAWSPQRSAKLAQRQYALLTAGLICLKSLGRLVYSTCALSKLENDQVIEKLFQKKEGFKVVEIPLVKAAERTKYGQMLMPDNSGYGPLYWCVIEKV
ncbi:MAG: RsmB/NOP family class I SAM-dependent RNA methyltransferase [Proteobacteria bacterium]|jgi:16S rRNA C967 or C1407 C5-methylase (RsmB/RsmF family)|nr:RsmB/NOP family class I SAM-dependent RNA methyltransferase [Pseudomonadota bacterium]